MLTSIKPKWAKHVFIMFSDEEEGDLGQPLQFALFNLFTFAWLFTFLSDFSLTFPDFFSRTAGAWLHRSHPERPDEAAAVQLDRGERSYLIPFPFHHDSDLTKQDSDHN